MSILVWLALMVGTALVCSSMAQSRGRPSGGWFVAGLFFPLLAAVVLGVLPPTEAKAEELALAEGQAIRCPRCQELVRPEASRCRHCTTDLEPRIQRSEKRFHLP